MRVEYSDSPLAIGTRKPRFSWEVPLAGRNRRQTACQVLVATSPDLLVPGKADLWDSGRMESRQSVHVEYAGKPLRSNMDCYWTVQVWDETGKACGFRPPGSFGTGLFDEADWQAQWIGMGPAEEPVFDPYAMHQDDATSGGLRLAEDDFQKLAPELRDYMPDLRSPQMRKAFVLDKPVKRARAFVCGLGLFELRLNGAKVGDDVLATPRTEFRKRLYYFTYDIAGHLVRGSNVVGIVLGNGWYNAQKKYWHWQAPWYGCPRALVQLEIEFGDGSSARVVGDASWQGDASPIGLNCIYDGEDYDARLEQCGWDAPGFDASGWRPVNLVAAPGGRLTAMEHESNRVMKRLRPVSLAEPEPGVFVFDMGTVMTGWAHLRIPQGRAGETVILRYAELLHDDGMINPSTAGGARQADHYTMKGAEEENYQPRFTYHGFRYVEVSGFPGPPGLDALEACFVYSGVEQSGTFACAHELINTIHRCTLQSQRCNLQMGVPTDDTQREERLGWCGDAWSYAEECFYNLDSARFWGKWIADVHDQQDPASGLVGYICPLPGWGEDLVWSAAFILIPWWHYIHYGDRRILEANYPYMKKYLAYLERTGKNELPDLAGRHPSRLLFPETPLEKRYPAAKDHGYLQHSWFADHLATHEGGSGMGKDQPRSMATAFYHYDAVVMARIAETLGHEEDARDFRGLAAKIKRAFNDRFFDAYGGYYDVGCQSVQALALAFDLVPEEQRGRVQSYLNSSVNFRQQRITSGYAGTKWVVHAIAHSERNDIVWNRAIATDYPSWGYMLGDNQTTITENWAGKASQCHTTLGAAIDEWFYWGLAGIRPDERAPGYEKIIIKPYLPRDLPWARARLRTPRGTIVSDWRQQDGVAVLNIEIPANSSAVVYLPAGDPEAITESGVAVVKAEAVARQETTTEGAVFAVGSGSYRFCFPVGGGRNADGLRVPRTTRDDLPQVLLVGDSISCGYTEPVMELLREICDIRRAPDNCGDTRRGLEKLDTWLGNTEWDLIHFNWGLHDLCHRHPSSPLYGNRDKINGPVSVPIEEYKDNLEKLVAKLLTRAPRLIWASTTVVPPGEAGRFQGDDRRYNDVAADIMRRHGIAVNDLHALTAAFDPSLFTCPGDVHFSEEGTRLIAEQVADRIQKQLSVTGPDHHNQLPSHPRSRCPSAPGARH